MEKDTINGWKKLSSKCEYDNPWISVFHEDVINPNGGHNIYGRIHFKHVAIGILPIDDEEHTWLVGQHRYPLNTYSWEIPEGGAPLNEDPLEAAKRELSEEVNLKAEHWTCIQKTDLSNSATDETCMIFLATGLSPCHLHKPDETEKLTIKRVPLQRFFDMVDDGSIRDAISVMAAMRYRLQNS